MDIKRDGLCLMYDTGPTSFPLPQPGMRLITACSAEALAVLPGIVGLTSWDRLDNWVFFLWSLTDYLFEMYKIMEAIDKVNTNSVFSPE